jgi:hypothetical protein
MTYFHAFLTSVPGGGTLFTKRILTELPRLKENKYSH